ncbi:MAG: DUF2854 domain-containing protein [Cyanothece sp. SIO1E1]|nr:DUF2854 domain-containing protein [Cyanothece sp. SIO1E1]
MLGKISLGSLGLVVGSILTVIGFVAYFQENATLNLVGFFYGIPLILGGLALSTTQLKPIPFSQSTSPEVLSLREQQATITQNKLRKDVTRYRYGQDVHLDEALQKVGLSPNDEQRPILEGLRETATENAYTLILEFDSSNLPLETWQMQQDKIERYFGPGIRAEFTQLAEGRVEMALITLLETPDTAAANA